ncbi:MAG: autotransporter-associated beta strand repeat-containing protein [Kiritimatiellia bacterium]
MGAGAVTLGGNRQVTVTAGTLTVGGVVGGGFGLTKSGAGKLTLSGVNAYSGATAINAGTLEIAGAGQLGSGAYAPGIVNNGTLHINSSANQTLSGVISGAAGALVKSGAGTLTLTNANTYGGGTTISPGGGTLLVSGPGAALGGGNISVGAGSTLTFATTGSIRTLPGNISGAGSINKGGTFRYYYSGDNGGFAGTYTQTGGDTSFLAATAASASARWVMDGAWMVFNLPASGTLHFGALSGGANTWNDSTTAVTTLEVGALGTDGVYSGIIGQGYGGATALTKVGAGRLILTAANVYTGATTIGGGVLQIGDGGTTGSLGTGPVTDHASLVFNRSNDLTVAQNIDGTGTLTQAGPGTLTLAGANSYAGTTLVSQGTLLLNGTTSTGGLIAVSAGASFGGGGSGGGHLRGERAFSAPGGGHVGQPDGSRRAEPGRRHRADV